jgi:hypothetical protein
MDEMKNGLKMKRLKCHGLRRRSVPRMANFLRLLPHTAAAKRSRLTGQSEIIEICLN